MSKTATILAVKSGALYRCSSWTPVDMEALKELHVWAGPRPVLETDPTFRQIIPYIVVRKADTMFAYVRHNSGGEARLANKLSVGLGGHVDASDAVFNESGEVDFIQTVHATMWRELEEEVGFRKDALESIVDINLKALIVSDANATDLVHLGVVIEMTIPEDADVEFAKTEEVTNHIFLSADDVADLDTKFDVESWSKLVIDHTWSDDNDKDCFHGDLGHN